MTNTQAAPESADRSSWRFPRGAELVAQRPELPTLLYGAALIIAVALAGFEGRQRLRRKRRAPAIQGA